MKMHKLNVVALTFTVSLLVSCGGATAPGGPVVLTAEPQSVEVPDYLYKHHCQADKLDGTRAYVLRGEGKVLVAIGNEEETPGSETTVTLETTLPATGVQIGRKVTGELFVFVSSADYSVPKSELVAFVDTDDDGLPEQATRTSICMMNNVGFGVSALERDEGIAYVLDGPGQRIFRVTDGNSDLMPDSVTTAAFVDSSQLQHSATSVAAATEHSVKVFVRDDRESPPADRVVTATDDDQDGDADSLTSEPLGGAETKVVNQPRDGETAVLVTSNVAGMFEIKDNGGLVLATFTARVGRQKVDLSRAVVENEKLELFEAQGTAAISETFVLAASTAVSVSHLGGERLLVDGGQVDVYGTNFTGQEVLEVIVDDEDETQWSEGTLVTSTAEKLVFDLPTLNITERERVVVRVLKNSTERKKLKAFFKTVVPD